MYLDDHHALLYQAAINIKHSEKTDFFTFREIIRSLGIYYFPDYPFGEENQYMDENIPLLQETNQFASLLTFLSNQHCNNYCEIGIYKGWSTLLIAAALSRNNQGLKVTGIDPYNSPNSQIELIFENLNIEYNHFFCDAEEQSGKIYDIVFIDGNHIYEYVKNDWENLGKYAKMCIFHDITNNFPENHNGGPEKLFNEIDLPKITFTTQTKVMGIGIVII